MSKERAEIDVFLADECAAIYDVDFQPGAKLVKIDESGFVYYTFSTPNDTQALVIQNPSSIIVIFKGTDGLEDIFTDLKIRRENNTHRGFKESEEEFFSAFETIFPENWLERSYPEKRMVVAGHSLGGAVAELFGLRMARQGWTVDVTTFGCPRVGNSTWRDQYNERLRATTNTYTNQNDPVPYLPFGFGYRNHIGTAIHWNGTKFKNKRPHRLKMWFRALTRFRLVRFILSSLGAKNHKMDKYRSVVRLWNERQKSKT